MKPDIPVWQMLTVGGTAVVAGGITQSWSLLAFGVGLMGSTTIASMVMEGRHHDRKV